MQRRIIQKQKYYRKTIIVLAKSRKPPGRCVAGIEIKNDGSLGNWVRPWDVTSITKNGGLSMLNLKNQNDVEIKNLDVVSFKYFERNSDHSYQLENVHISPKRYENIFFHTGKFKKEHLLPKIEESLPWLEGSNSNGFLYNRIPESELKDIKRSLCLIQRDIEITAFFKNNKKVLAVKFNDNNHEVRAQLTCPLYEKQLAIEVGQDPIILPNAIMCVSLGEIWKGFCYKLVASIIL
jgi:hypothetical protein